ncbi:MAG TPA: uracil-DNA glycosylase family protein [Acidimicrobiales bacterium]|nr:uracil-DNA glycosylase family protein [Acidimicrobiales bacterium]
MDRGTVDVYEHHAERWQARRRAQRVDAATELGRRIAVAGLRRPVVDLGCGPGWHAPALSGPAGDGRGVVTLDAARAMLDLVPGHAPAAMRVQADLSALPFARGALGGAWASKSYVHLARGDVPMALHDLHRCLALGAPCELHAFTGELEHGPLPLDDEFAGRRFSRWPERLLLDVVTGAGFGLEAVDHHQARDGVDVIAVRATRERTLPDSVAPGMRLLVCGLNPSVYSADAGVPFARPGNRFWPAALAAGLVARDRDPVDALERHGVGMTDLVKRATPRADELTRDEYRAGVARLTRLVAWLRPGAVCFVGLAGWRAAVDRAARPGPQPDRLGGTPIYVMPSTSGVNARVGPDELTRHLRDAAALANG